MKSKYIVYLGIIVGPSALLYGLLFGYINIKFPDIGREFPDIRRDVGLWLLVSEWIIFFTLTYIGVRMIIKRARQDPPEDKNS